MPRATRTLLIVVAVGLAAMAVVRRRGGLPIASLIVSVAVLAFAGFFHFVAARVPVAPTAFVVGQPAPELTLPDSAGTTRPPSAVNTSSTRSAVPSCRYGAVSHAPSSVGVSMPASVVPRRLPDVVRSVPTSRSGGAAP